MIITQGTLRHPTPSTATITTRGGEPVRAVLTGWPGELKQQLDDGKPMNARANQVDYDLTTEIVVFTGNVKIEQPRGTLRGERVVYDMKTGQVDSGGDGSGRVKMPIIQPKQPPDQAGPRATN